MIPSIYIILKKLQFILILNMNLMFIVVKEIMVINIISYIMPQYSQDLILIIFLMILREKWLVLEKLLSIIIWFRVYSCFSYNKRLVYWIYPSLFKMWSYINWMNILIRYCWKIYSARVRINFNSFFCLILQ